MIYVNALYLHENTNEVPYDMRFKSKPALQTRNSYGKQTMNYQVLSILNELDDNLDFNVTRNAFKNKNESIVTDTGSEAVMLQHSLLSISLLLPFSSFLFFFSE